MDGDTLVIGAETVRLIGIDAPETDQQCVFDDGSNWPCGERAATALGQLLADGPMTCTVYGRDRWERALAVCRNEGDGRPSINARLVSSGWALAWYPETGAVLGPAFKAEEAAARNAQRGLWRGEFIEPWEWRR